MLEAQQAAAQLADVLLQAHVPGCSFGMDFFGTVYQYPVVKAHHERDTKLVSPDSAKAMQDAKKLTASHFVKVTTSREAAACLLTLQV